MIRSISIAAALILVANAGAHAQYATRATGSYSVADSTYGRNRGAGAKTGALWGAGIGAGISIFGALTGDSCTNYGNGTGTHCTKLSSDETTVLIAGGTVLGALVGAAVGAVIGKQVHTPAQSRIAVQLLPATAHVRIAF